MRRYKRILLRRADGKIQHYYVLSKNIKKYKYNRKKRYWGVKKAKKLKRIVKKASKTYILVALFITNESNVVNGRVATYVFKTKSIKTFIKRRLRKLIYRDTEFFYYADNPDNIYQDVFYALKTKKSSFLISKLPIFVSLDASKNEDKKLIKKFNMIKKDTRGVDIDI
ncbi:MAG: hypothetical protein QXU98_08160 [Candidatus Parvarchaeota archaeon]